MSISLLSWAYVGCTTYHYFFVLISIAYYENNHFDLFFNLRNDRNIFSGYYVMGLWGDQIIGLKPCVLTIYLHVFLLLFIIMFHILNFRGRLAFATSAHINIFTGYYVMGLSGDKVIELMPCFLTIN